MSETYDLNKAWQQMEESFIQGMTPVQGISLNPEYEEEKAFDFNVAKQKLDSLYTNVGASSQSAEFGGNDAWLVSGKYPLADNGKPSVFIFASDDAYRGSDSFDLFQRVLLPSTEYDDTPIDSGPLEQILAKAQQLKPIKEVDSPDKAIERRDREEKSSPMDRFKTLKIDGVCADLLDMEMKKTGNVEWTDSFQGSGPYLPPEVEDYVLAATGNNSEEPFNVSFVKYGSSHPQEGRGAPIYVEYEQDVVSNPNEFGKRDIDESTNTNGIEELRKLLKVDDLDIEVDIYFGIVKIGSLIQDETGEWDVFIQNKPLHNSYPTKEEAFAAFVNYIRDDQ